MLERGHKQKNNEGGFIMASKDKEGVRQRLQEIQDKLDNMTDEENRALCASLSQVPASTIRQLDWNREFRRRSLESLYSRAY